MLSIAHCKKKLHAYYRIDSLFRLYPKWHTKQCIIKISKAASVILYCWRWNEHVKAILSHALTPCCEIGTNHGLFAIGHMQFLRNVIQCALLFLLFFTRSFSEMSFSEPYCRRKQIKYMCVHVCVHISVMYIKMVWVHCFFFFASYIIYYNTCKMH